MRLRILVLALLCGCASLDDYREHFVVQPSGIVDLATVVRPGTYSVELGAYWDGEQTDCWFSSFRIEIRTAQGNTTIPIEIPNLGDDHSGPVAGKSASFTVDAPGTLYLEIAPGTCLLLFPGLQTPGTWQVCHDAGCLPWDVADTSGYVRCDSSLGASVACDGLVPAIPLNEET